MKPKRAMIAGATGLIGNELLQILLREQQYEHVCALVRQPLALTHPKLQVVVCDFDRLEAFKGHLAVDDVFCCLGTTINKAKTREAMYRVDVEYPVALARLAREQGAAHFLVVSAADADVKSFFWYRRLKGTLEAEITGLPYPAISIFRPSLLLGPRKEFRLFENLAVKSISLLSGLLHRPLSSQAAIAATVVAQAMYRVAQAQETGVHIYSPRQIAAIEQGTAVI
ncbi:MAG: NAD(P)H-binding protein [Sporomusaceae bacterium]|nr:NAD(P)H-binding protein [Sporomusaceae bacterium]